MDRIIWRYWEGPKPSYIEKLERQPLRFVNCARLIYLTNKTVKDFIPDLPFGVGRLQARAHKADVIRSFLLMRYGGLWLDADILILKNIDHLFEELEQSNKTLLSFNDTGQLVPGDRLRIGVLAAKPHCPIITDWNKHQVGYIKYNKKFNWTHIGSDMITNSAERHPNNVILRKLSEIEPIPWQKAHLFYENIDINDVIKSYHTMISFHNSQLLNKEFSNDLGSSLINFSNTL